MGYGGGESIGDSGGSGDVYKGRAEPMLDSVSDLYSEDEIISVGGSRPSSSPAYTLY